MPNPNIIARSAYHFARQSMMKGVLDVESGRKIKDKEWIKKEEI